MAKITLQTNEPKKDFPLLPEDSLHEVQVTGIKQKVLPAKGDRPEKTMLDFEFTIKTPGEWEDKRIWGSVALWFSMSPQCRLRNWVQSILGTELEPGYELDTDDLIGRNARITVQYRHGTGAYEGRTFQQVGDVLPSRTQAASSFTWGTDAPAY